MNNLISEKDCLPGCVLPIGQIPNPLAIAHLLAATPLFQKKVAFVVLESEVERYIISNALVAFGVNTDKILEWTGNATDLLRISEEKIFVITDRRTVEQKKLPSLNTFRNNSLRLSIKDELSLGVLKEFLTENGFERDATANLAGRWATRGSVVDVNIDKPVRLELSTNKIESLYTFDLKTGKKLKPLDTITIPPLQLKGRSSVLHYLSKDALLVSFHVDNLKTECAQIVLDSLESPNQINAGYQETKSYHLRYEEILLDASKNKYIHVFTKDQKKSAAIFKDAKVYVHPTDIDQHGFEHQEMGIIAFTDQSIGLAEQAKKQQAAKVRQAMVQTLQPGDYVVHLYHGIARFEGTTQMFVNKMNREYFVLEYASNDKIYVPVEMADYIDKYLGDPNPTLHRLSDASWHEVVNRVKAQTLELARELLNLYANRTLVKASMMSHKREEVELDGRCPFDLTSDQQQALEEVFNDMTQDKPMDRLLCGDVGFGKTEVALRAAFRAVLNGYQVVLLAPTTVLTQQHYDTFMARLEGFGVNVGLLSRMQTQKQQKKTIDQMKNGLVDITIGTHRLLSRDIAFKRLGLTIVDEEQRFGVRAKEKLKQLRTSAHILSMTATPIPRTLHLSLSGVRDISTILTAPNARRAVSTEIQRMNSEVIQKAITTEKARQGQTYYIYNRVQSIHQREKDLQRLLPGVRFGIAHGQMDPKHLSEVMHKFDTGQIDVLLATTIVENGLDIPNANTLIVENASLFGLSELYQLRGRVGRAERQGYAYFLYKEERPDADAKKRYMALQQAKELGSGFELAMKDLEIRGVGNILGREQHGHATKIGMHLYIRLLNQAVQELEGIEVMPERDIPIDLPLEARIPENLLPEQEDRILLYQQLANIRDLSLLHKKKEQFANKERFTDKGKINTALQGLFDLLEIKLLAARSTLLSIDTTHPTTMNRLESPRLTISADKPFQQLPCEWEEIFKMDSGQYKAKTTVEMLGSNWVEKLKALIRNNKAQ